MADFQIDDTVDITDVVCPVTFVKAKVVQNVPRSIKEEGHQILKLIDNEDGTYDLIVKKVEDE